MCVSGIKKTTFSTKIDKASPKCPEGGSVPGLGQSPKNTIFWEELPIEQEMKCNIMSALDTFFALTGFGLHIYESFIVINKHSLKIAQPYVTLF